MTTKDFSIKWLAYALALLPVWFAQAFLVNRFPLFGVVPSLLPLAAVAVAVLEGASAGAGFASAFGAGGVSFLGSGASVLAGAAGFSGVSGFSAFTGAFSTSFSSVLGAGAAGAAAGLGSSSVSGMVNALAC